MSPVETPPIDPEDLTSFHHHIQNSKRILALCGAGLSASSGLPTFRGAGGFWRNFVATDVATPDAFQQDPALVWQFYNYRRHMALKAQPNRAHLALAELARKRPDFLTISQNVDGLSPRAHHPPENLELLHGSLFDVRCTSFECDYSESNNFTDPITSALEVPRDPNTGEDLDISKADIHLRQVSLDDLPHCPKCKDWLIRPGVVWFGESLPMHTMGRVTEWMSQTEPIDLIIVIGTSAQVYPAAGYIQAARFKGARVAVVNTERPEDGASKLQKGDWFFQGDAGIIIPQILEPITGPIPAPTEKL